MHLVLKTREGAKTKRIYDVPRTPYDRVLESDDISSARKSKLRRQYQSLDTVELLADLRQLQYELWAFGYSELPSRRGGKPREVVKYVEVSDPPQRSEDQSEVFHKTRKPHKKHKKHKRCVHWWRTCPDAFESVWSECEAYLNEQPNLSTVELLRRLQARHPDTFKDKQLRTLQRRVRTWRLTQMYVNHGYRKRGHGLPEEHEIEIVVTPQLHNADKGLRYDFR
jgi:hypothetical protein